MIGLILIELSWITQFETEIREEGLCNNFLEYICLKEIIAIITSIPIDIDIFPYFWGEIDSRIPAELLSIDDRDEIETLIETITEKLYDHLYKLLGKQYDKYIYHTWKHRTLIMTHIEKKHHFANRYYCMSSVDTNNTPMW